MCGIIGYSSDAPEAGDFTLLRELMNESKVRGLHAFGLAVRSRNGWQFSRQHKLDKITSKLRPWESEEAVGPKALLFHNRYSTSGDFHDHANNQPVRRHCQFLVFNGTIHMGTKEEREREFKTKFETDNDGEILLAKLEADDDRYLREFLRNSQASVACLYGHMATDSVYVFRNARRPAWAFRHGQSTFVASTKDIIQRAHRTCRRPLPPMREVPCGASYNLKDL